MICLRPADSTPSRRNAVTADSMSRRRVCCLCSGWYRVIWQCSWSAVAGGPFSSRDERCLANLADFSLFVVGDRPDPHANVLVEGDLRKRIAARGFREEVDGRPVPAIALGDALGIAYPIHLV